MALPMQRPDEIQPWPFGIPPGRMPPMQRAWGPPPQPGVQVAGPGGGGAPPPIPTPPPRPPNLGVTPPSAASQMPPPLAGPLSDKAPPGAPPLTPPTPAPPPMIGAMPTEKEGGYGPDIPAGGVPPAPAAEEPGGLQKALGDENFMASLGKAGGALAGLGGDGGGVKPSPISAMQANQGNVSAGEAAKLFEELLAGRWKPPQRRPMIPPQLGR